MILEKAIKWGNTNPRKLFLIDGFGAILSAIFLGIVLVQFERFFGIPKQTLYFLASLPCLFAIYDFYCFHKIDDRLGISLKRIAVLNLIYCCLSIVLFIYHRHEIMLFGWVYIVVEIMVVYTLAVFELRVANAIRKAT
ncbi:hypothetical protein QQ008_24265 [Fulvivirgaceae bacterium BMA10]|uniref:Uncharacterized protein n=1 Tax=Splendidivirga corallicola TaxID=3051826 RepID=A0ABT8KUS3_9BACT|nr:hypothetical protein [Fulvivirgaceae bacterium BMA10]